MINLKTNIMIIYGLIAYFVIAFAIGWYALVTSERID